MWLGCTCTRGHTFPFLERTVSFWGDVSLSFFPTLYRMLFTVAMCCLYKGNHWHSSSSDEEPQAEKKTGDKTNIFLVSHLWTIISESVPPQLWHKQYLLVVAQKKGVRKKSMLLEKQKLLWTTSGFQSVCFFYLFMFFSWSHSWHQLCSTHKLTSLPAFKAQQQILSRLYTFSPPCNHSE